jgi:hypothetical protein
MSRQGNQAIDQYYAQHGGMPPEWLREYLPVGKGGMLIPTEWINPGGTLGNIAGELPGATTAQSENILSELAPAATAGIEELSGTNKFGQAYKGTGALGLPARFVDPISEAVGKFKPIGLYNTFTSSKKGGTFEQGPKAALESLSPVAPTTLRNPTQTAGLGEKDYEQSLSVPDKVKFQLNQKLVNFAAEAALYQRVTGQPLGEVERSRILGDFHSVEQRDLFQYSYAQSHGAKAWKSLPPLNKLAGTLDWMAHHGFSHAQVAAAQQMGSHLNNDKDVEALVNGLWQATGIGQVDSFWKSTVKGMKPPTLTKANP